METGELVEMFIYDDGGRLGSYAVGRNEVKCCSGIVTIQVDNLLRLKCTLYSQLKTIEKDDDIKMPRCFLCRTRCSSRWPCRIMNFQNFWLFLLPWL